MHYEGEFRIKNVVIKFSGDAKANEIMAKIEKEIFSIAMEREKHGNQKAEKISRKMEEKEMV